MWLSRTPFNGGMKRIQFSATYPKRFIHPLHQQIMERTSISRAELLMWSPTEDATTLFWCDGDREATEKAIAHIDSLLVSNFVVDNDGTYAFLRQSDYEFASALLDTIEGSNVIFLPPVVFLETGEVQFEAVGETAALSTFYEKLSELGELTIEQVHDFERKNSPSHLTDRQEAALEAAVSVGYYEVPREGTVADIAGVLNCSTSTAGELVRKAEAAVIQSHTETE
ncbi:helix-turn-helix domain-containing protein [Halostagnicola kamekurae]|uniref:Predicted DNA binding protein, contains HTH domain n=1 Tax=Halostagnicola kamekurae TaxID=619731 RepID=A0A1I6PZF1_9EURY|nr:helix-turn-helix domain-containing protein [Halostagnicola kamekurae]SFS45554.1 Predicted DNA binding protein, contains HTH domain [Halostagnicola kamekurae]